MYLISVILLGMAANLDNLCIGISFGISGKSIKPVHNLIISVISGIVTFLACEVAQLIGPYRIQESIYAGASLLIITGLYTIVIALKNKHLTKNCTVSPKRKSGVISVLLLGTLLAINNLAAAFAAGLSDVSALHLSISMTAFSMLCIGVGGIIGKKAKNLYSECAIEVISGVMLLALGVWEMLS